MDTIIKQDRICFQPGCECPYVEQHHVWAGSYRNASERYGLKVYMCHDHHMKLHENETDMMKMRAFAQGYAMAYYGWTLEEFMEKIGRSFL